MPWRNGGIRYSLIRDRVSTQGRWDFLKVHDYRLPSFSAPGRYLVTSQLTAIGGRDYVYCSNQARKVAISSNRKVAHHASQPGLLGVTILLEPPFLWR